MVVHLALGPEPRYVPFMDFHPSMRGYATIITPQLIDFSPAEFSAMYLKQTRRLQGLFADIDETLVGTIDRISRERVTLAAPVAYSVLEAKVHFKQDPEDKVYKSDAFYSRRYGAVIRLGTPEDMCRKYVHEVAHAVDDVTGGDEARSATMGEVMAILVERVLGYRTRYAEDPHKRASCLLDILEESLLKDASFAEKWLYLQRIRRHEIRTA